MDGHIYCQSYKKYSLLFSLLTEWPFILFGVGLENHWKCICKFCWGGDQDRTRKFDWNKGFPQIPALGENFLLNPVGSYGPSLEVIKHENKYSSFQVLQHLYPTNSSQMPNPLSDVAGVWSTYSAISYLLFLPQQME